VTNEHIDFLSVEDLLEAAAADMDVPEIATRLRRHLGSAS
jgi:hypothetical protein